MHVPLFTAPDRLSAAWSQALVAVVDWGLPLWIAGLLIATLVDRAISRRRATVTRSVRGLRQVDGGPYRGGFVDESRVVSEERPWRARFWRRAGANALFAVLATFVWLAFGASRDLADYRKLREAGHTVAAQVFRVDEWGTGCRRGCREYAVSAQLPDGTIVRDWSSPLGAHYAKMEPTVPWTMGPEGVSQIGPIEEIGIRVLPAGMIPFFVVGLLVGHARMWRRA
jgi:hypothetical protein